MPSQRTLDERADKFVPRPITAAQAAQGYNNEGKGQFQGCIADPAQHEINCGYRRVPRFPGEERICNCRIGLWKSDPIPVNRAAEEPSRHTLDVYRDTKAELKKKTQRVPLHLNCPAGAAHEAQAMRDGFIKYGYGSFLNDDVHMSATEILGAALRHVQRLLGGEDCAPDSNVHHAGHARAMLGIYLECMEAGKLVDDRHPTQKKGYIGRMFDRLFRENVANDSAADSAKK